MSRPKGVQLCGTAFKSEWLRHFPYSNSQVGCKCCFHSQSAVLDVLRSRYTILADSNWPFSNPEATWEFQAHVQRFPLSEPFDLTFSFLVQGYEPHVTRLSPSAYAHGINANARHAAWRIGYKNNTYAPLENKSI